MSRLKKEYAKLVYEINGSNYDELFEKIYNTERKIDYTKTALYDWNYTGTLPSRCKIVLDMINDM